MYLSLRERPATGPPQPTGRRPRVAPVVVTLGLVSLLTDVSSESVNAVLPLYLTGVLGLSAIAYGFVDGLYQGVSALVRLAAGVLSDRTGRPKWVAASGYALSALARVLLLLAGNAAAVSGVVAADRVGKGVRTAPRDAMISAASPPEGLGRAFGVHRTLDTVGAALGPLMAFVILWFTPDGYRSVMVASLAAAVVGVALIVLFVPDVRRGGAGAGVRALAGPAPVRVRWRDVADPRLRRLLLVVGGLGLLTIGDGFLYLALLDRSRFAAQWFPLLYVGTNVAYLLLALPLGRLADRVGRARVLVGGHVALLAAYLLAVVPLAGWVPTVAALVALGAFYAATDGLTAAVAGRLVPVELRASGIASAQTVVALARLVASSTFGLLWFAVGPARALLLVAAVLALALPLALTQVVRLDHDDVGADAGAGAPR